MLVSVRSSDRRATLHKSLTLFVHVDAVIVDDNPNNVSAVDFGEFSIVFDVRDDKIKLESTFVC